MLLAGDIGGTKTSLALYASADDLRTPLAEATFPSARYAGLEAVVDEFLAHSAAAGARVERASFGVAGPVVRGEAKVTNLPWTLAEERLMAALDIPRVRLLNDLAAIAYAVPHLGGADLRTISAGEPAPDGALAVIAPGTGLGEAFLTGEREGGYTVHASEGGHCDFAPTNEEEMALLRYLLATEDHVSYERVCSGLGIPNIYAYLLSTGRYEEPEELREALEAAVDRTPVIMTAALEGTRAPALCAKTLEMFVSILAAEAGNLALKVLATGGVYLAGGIPPRIEPQLASAAFRREFQRKGRFAHLLDAVPIHVILNPKVALLGAARYAATL
jgi:glucokinase